MLNDTCCCHKNNRFLIKEYENISKFSTTWPTLEILQDDIVKLYYEVDICYSFLL